MNDHFGMPSVSLSTASDELIAPSIAGDAAFASSVAPPLGVQPTMPAAAAPAAPTAPNFRKSRRENLCCFPMMCSLLVRYLPLAGIPILRTEPHRKKAASSCPPATVFCLRSDHDRRYQEGVGMRYAGSRHETASGRGPWIFGNWITSSSWHSWGVSPRRPTSFFCRARRSARPCATLSTNWGNRYWRIATTIWS